MSTADLCDEYEAWNKANGLNLGSADEHLFDDDLTEVQRKWLADFSKRWEMTVGAEDDRYEGKCTDPDGHIWIVSDDTDDRFRHGEGRVYCEICGADGEG